MGITKREGRGRRNGYRSQEGTPSIQRKTEIQLFMGGKVVFLVHGPDYRKKDDPCQGQAHRDAGKHPIPFLGNTPVWAHDTRLPRSGVGPRGTEHHELGPRSAR